MRKSNKRYSLLTTIPCTSQELIHNLNFVWSIWLNEEHNRYVELRLNQQVWMLGGTYPEDNIANHMLHWKLCYGSTLYHNLDGSMPYYTLDIQCYSNASRSYDTEDIVVIDPNSGEKTPAEHKDAITEIIAVRRAFWDRIYKPMLLEKMQHHALTMLRVIERGELGTDISDGELDGLEAELISGLSDLTIQDIEHCQMFNT